jgi:carbamoyltransferase
MMWVLGIAGSHNSAVALVRDGRVVVAVQVERLVRQKGAAISLGEMGSHAGQAIAYCLAHADIDLPDVDAIATCTPWDAVRPSFAFVDVAAASTRTLPPFVTVPHHLTHAEYALHYTDLEPSLVVVCDGSGTYEHQRGSLDLVEQADRPVLHTAPTSKECISAYSFDGDTLRLRYRMGADPVPGTSWLASIGQLWEWAAWYSHGSAPEAGKVMGLAAYGDPEVHSDLATLSVGPTGAVAVDLPTLLARFDRPNVAGVDVTGDRHYEDLAAHVQQATSDALVDLVRFLRTIDPAPQLCYSGGVALNGVANEEVRRRLGVELQANGSCGDNGTAIGAALAVHHAATGERVAEPVTEYYGREYGHDEIAAALAHHDGPTVELAGEELIGHVAEAIAAGALVGWFQGRSELGPRALGNRSILADPRDPLVPDRLNRLVKGREAFRPFAPAVLEAHASELFELDGPSPVMLRVVRVRDETLPAITHVDGSARVQTVNRQQNPLFHDLIAAFGAATGVPVLLNTSFNRAGEPIVETPADAVHTFAASGLDLLVMSSTVTRQAGAPRALGAAAG